MAEQRSKASETAASVALFLTILVVSVALALLTELHVAARWAIAIGTGMVAAAVTYITLKRRTDR